MTVITILPESPTGQPPSFRAVADGKQSVGPTVGQALDALTAALGAEDTTFVIVQRMRPDALFTEEQQHRLSELMDKWRAARDGGTPLSSEDQTELADRVQAEVRAAGERAAAMLRHLPSCTPTIRRLPDALAIAACIAALPRSCSTSRLKRNTSSRGAAAARMRKRTSPLPAGRAISARAIMSSGPIPKRVASSRCSNLAPIAGASILRSIWKPGRFAV